MNLKINVLFLSLFILFVMPAFAQPPNQGDPGIFEEIDDVPVDGAIMMLATAGIGIGIRKLYKKKSR